MYGFYDCFTRYRFFICNNRVGGECNQFHADASSVTEQLRIMPAVWSALRWTFLPVAKIGRL